MPIYEYVCQACGQETEIIHKISDPPERKCPNCGKNKLVKLVSAAAFRLKGGGWYETDFKSDSDKKKNLVADKDKDKAAVEAPKAGVTAAAKPKEAKAEAKADSKSESKPAATPDKASKSLAKPSAKPVKKAAKKGK